MRRQGVVLGRQGLAARDGGVRGLGARRRVRRLWCRQRLLRVLELRGRGSGKLIVQVSDLSVVDWEARLLEVERLANLADGLLPHLVLHGHLREQLEHVGESELMAAVLLVHETRDLEALERELKVIALVAWAVRSVALPIAAHSFILRSVLVFVRRSSILLFLERASERVALELRFLQQRLCVCNVRGGGLDAVLAVFGDLLLESFDERLDLRVQLLRCRRHRRRHSLINRFSFAPKVPLVQTAVRFFADPLPCPSHHINHSTVSKKVVRIRLRWCHGHAFLGTGNRPYIVINTAQAFIVVYSHHSLVWIRGKQL